MTNICMYFQEPNDQTHEKITSPGKFREISWKVLRCEINISYLLILKYTPESYNIIYMKRYGRYLRLALNNL